jgi:hypothetical protein
MEKPSTTQMWFLPPKTLRLTPKNTCESPRPYDASTTSSTSSEWLGASYDHEDVDSLEYFCGYWAVGTLTNQPIDWVRMRVREVIMTNFWSCMG